MTFLDAFFRNLLEFCRAEGVSAQITYLLEKTVNVHGGVLRWGETDVCEVSSQFALAEQEAREGVRVGKDGTRN